MPRSTRQRLADIVPLAIRFMDDVVDVSNYPLAAQAQEAKAKRRIGPWYNRPCRCARHVRT